MYNGGLLHCHHLLLLLQPHWNCDLALFAAYVVVTLRHITVSAWDQVVVVILSFTEGNQPTKCVH